MWLPSLTAFNVSPDNPNLCSVDGVLFSKYMGDLLAYPCSKGLADGGSYTIPNGVYAIWSGVFSGVQTLTSITIPASVQLIFRDAFSRCSLQSITFKGKKGDYHYCFEDLFDLRDVYCLADEVPEFGSSLNFFADCYLEYATLHVPEALIEDYRSTEPWSRFGNIVALTDEEAGIENLTADSLTKAEGSHYTLNGVKLNGTPTQKGVYIMNGKKVVVK